jgi:hypothetical protein
MSQLPQDRHFAFEKTHSLDPLGFVCVLIEQLFDHTTGIAVRPIFRKINGPHPTLTKWAEKFIPGEPIRLFTSAIYPALCQACVFDCTR